MPRSFLDKAIYWLRDVRSRRMFGAMRRFSRNAARAGKLAAAGPQGDQAGRDGFCACMALGARSGRYNRAAFVCSATRWTSLYRGEHQARTIADGAASFRGVPQVLGRLRFGPYSDKEHDGQRDNVLHGRSNALTGTRGEIDGLASVIRVGVTANCWPFICIQELLGPRPSPNPPAWPPYRGQRHYEPAPQHLAYQIQQANAV